MAILVTGAAGFIGFHLAARLLERGEEVVGVDDLNDYYDVGLKRARLARLMARKGFRFERLDIAEAEAFAALTARVRPRAVIHLAAQAGVRHSIDNPHIYGRSNLAGHLSVLEACRRADGLDRLIYASSSSVYGRTAAIPFTEADACDKPASLYGATKRAGELMSEAYASLYGLRQAGLRFFTVYGPWGRPDMAYWLFTDAILAGRPIRLFNRGDMRRDFTYVDDIVDGVVALLDRGDLFEQGAHRLFNIGAGRPLALGRFVEVLEEAIGVKATIEHDAMQPGDVAETYADVSALKAAVGYAPTTPLEIGAPRFVAWFKDWRGRAAA